MAQHVAVKRSYALMAGPPVKLSWSAIFGGTIVALGLWVLLYSFGLALGLSAIDPANPGSAKAAGIGTGVWSLVAPLIALFVGGMVASRTAGIVDRFGGAIHGAVLWSLATIAGVIVMGMALSSLVGSVVNLGGKAVGAAGSAVSQSGGKDLSRAGDALGLNMNDLLGPVNQRLRAEGKPALTADQLQAATRDAISDGLRQGRLDRAVLVQSIAEKTALSRQDAEDIAGRIETQFNGKKDQIIGQVQTGALNAADKTGKAFWGVFAALLFGLISAVLGATAGVTQRQRLIAEKGTVAPLPGLPPSDVRP